MGDSRSSRRLIGTGLLAVVVVGVVAVGLLGTRSSVRAQDTEQVSAIAEAAAGASESSCTNGGMVGTPCVGRGIKESLRTVSGKIISPAFRIALIQALLNLSQFVLDRLAYEAATAIASGGPGEDSLFYKKEPADAFAQLGLEVAGEAVGMLSELSSEELGVKFNLCDPGAIPGGAALDLNLAIGIKQKYKPQKPKCDILEMGANWQGFFTNAYQSFSDPDARKNAILSKFAESLQPGKNELTATLRLNIAIDNQVHEQKLLQFNQQNAKEYKSVTDFVTGNVKTPSSTLQGKFEKQMEEVNGDQSKIQVGELVNAGELIGGLALTTASTFTNTLLSTLLNRVYTGLFDTAPDPDPFDLEALAGGGREAAQERFASIITTNPIATAQYNALSEFVVCPAEGVTNRGLYNCVMDVNFLAAVSRGNSSAAITVQEAIDEGLLNGDWPLISPDDQAANQDPFCYTYGYCYGNLVKLRKARVLPIGWELAAARNNPNDPASLQEIIDKFDDCTDDGTIGPANGDGEAKWCHLIDPNWVLKYPDTQCRAIANGEIRLSSLSAGRASVCVDSPSCISENNDGVCTGGYGYCVQEKNAWRFRGDECPEQFATCLALKNVDTGDSAGYLVNTVDYSVCSQQNAGCLWYRTGKTPYNGGTSADPSDDTFEWLPADASAYLTAAAETAEGAYEDRIYFTNNVTTCSESDGGCTQLYPLSAALNHIQNPSFEQDEDGDEMPDFWLSISPATTTEGLSTENPSFGEQSFRTGSTTMYQYVEASPNNFYTLSFYARSNVPAPSGGGTVNLLLFNEDGAQVSVAGTSFGGDCALNASSTGYYVQLTPTNTTQFPTAGAWERFECTFTTPATVDQAQVTLSSGPSPIFFDAVQLQVGENTTTFTEGYSVTPAASHYKVAPAYLGCAGLPTDPPECDRYATVCSAQDVGCNLYTPEDGDPSVPAITSSLDACPSECVGYTTYKQEATAYESEDFPLYFIADKATQCSQQYVGCDAYTNLGAASAGGESVEYYTNLRYCLTPSIANSSNSQKVPATFFTWEGSDNEGYQLRTWYLLESNVSFTAGIFTNSSFIEAHPDFAPCTTIEMISEDEVQCADNGATLTAKVWSNVACDEHDDIFTNPDCREFFDTDGNIHYREYSDTVSISESCTAYRKDVGNQTDCNNSGGFWTDQGFCRYYTLPEESVECPAAQNGCREYTGGTGRNATTILSETFEGGTYEDFVMADIGSNTSTLSISNESLATNGHSLRVLAPSGGAGGFEIVQVYLDAVNRSETYDADTPTTCTDNGGVVGDQGCEVEFDVNSDGSADEACSIADGEESCGALTNALVGGKTFNVEFWAKGTGSLSASFIEEGGVGLPRDLIDPQSETAISPDAVTLTGAWQLYSFGPLDTSAFTNFDENAVLRFSLTSGAQLYIDNIALKQVEENVTVIKDSWVVPSTCYQTPDGIETDPPYYLGCEAYTDQDGQGANLYQFSDLCSEEVVGCEGFYLTHNSESPYQEIFNARCVYSTDADLDDGDTAPTNTACVVDGTTYCTVPAGEGYCTFDVQQVFEEPLPTSSSAGTTFGIVYGPETVIVPADEPVYVVADDGFACGAQAAGCQEVGVPTFNQDKSQVLSFESAYFLNQPEDYTNTLCSNEALFCAEWSSTKDGNFYFKDPFDKTCEYKTSVTIGGQEYRGWFRTGTSAPCYAPYLVAGEEYGIWRNGDAAYDEWVGSCGQEYDLCTQFTDVVDTAGGGATGEGTSYYFTRDELLEEETLTDSQRCNGAVSQKEGCVLFNNTTISELTANASASYAVSVHADELLGEEPNSLQDPVNCDIEGGGEFTTAQGDTYDLCARRCTYTLNGDDTLETTSAQQYFPPIIPIDQNLYFERSCLADADCPVLTSRLGEEEDGTCVNVSSVFSSTAAQQQYRLSNDVNQILKVNRDRECSTWLSSSSSRVSWNPRTNKYEEITDALGLCIDGNEQGLCLDWESQEPLILTVDRYASRNVTWSGFEYSGYAIPDQLPVGTYDQRNINPGQWCVDDSQDPVYENGFEITCSNATDCPTNPDGDSCVTNSNCGNGACDTVTGQCRYDCDPASSDYYLVYDAGPCSEDESGRGEACTIGFCSDSGDACAAEDDCAASESCVIGYCQEQSAVACVGPDICSGPTPVCDQTLGVCVSQLIPNESYCVTSADCSGDAVCVPSSATVNGTCFNDRCLADVRDGDGDGRPDPLDVVNIDADDDGIPEDRLVGAEGFSCRAYPEATSPWPSQVVTYWKTGDGDPTTLPNEPWSRPFDFVNGFTNSDVCNPGPDGEPNDDCLCSYDKVEYGQGTTVRYFGDITFTELAGDLYSMDAVCAGGPLNGLPCDPEAENACGTGGICERAARINSVLGWDGYCVERDSSIQLYGSQADKDRACLTWLPVDQLSGATDLFGKATEAGYPLQDTFYCSEVETYVNAYVSNKAQIEAAIDAGDLGQGGIIACAENEGACTDGNDCAQNVFCPEGYFAILGPCKPAGDSAYNDTYSESCAVSSGGDNDCPYICVPKNSTLPDGTSCDPEAGEIPGNLNGPTVIDQWRSNEDFSGTEQYQIDLFYNYGPNAFVNRVAAYLDCANRGIPFGTYGLSPTPADTIGAYPTGLTTHRSLMFTPQSYYAACTSLLQVSTSNESDANKAWTDRLWTGSGWAGITAGNGYQDELGYEYGTLPTPYGASAYDPFNLTIPATNDQIPVIPNQCINELNIYIPTANNSCTDGQMYFPTTSTPSQARSYHYFTTEFTGIECDSVSDCLPEADISCNLGSLSCVISCSSNADCEFTYENSSGDDVDVDLGACLESGVCEDDLTPVSQCDEAGGTTYGACEGGELENQPCSEDLDCAGSISCATIWRDGFTTVQNYCQGGLFEITGSMVAGSDDLFESVADRLKQIFAKTFDIFTFDAQQDGIVGSLSPNSFDLDTTGEYNEVEVPIELDYDISVDTEGDDEPEVPKIASIGLCSGTQCQEGDHGTFDVNDQTQGTILGTGQKRITVNFFAWAGKNQMPIKNIVVDWGNSFAFNGVGEPDWPIEIGYSQSGSATSDNFYKNVRGYSPAGTGYCDGSEWGKTSESCSQAYVSFTHDYACSVGDVEDLEDAGRDCEVGEDGRLVNSPCTGGDVIGAAGACVFQPRVHARDNWGWCTGYCDNKSVDPSGNEECWESEECRIDACPGPSPCISSTVFPPGIDNPWIFWDGYIVVTPE